MSVTGLLYLLEVGLKLEYFKPFFSRRKIFWKSSNVVRITTESALVWCSTQSIPINSRGTWFCVENKKLKHTRMQSSYTFFKLFCNQKDIWIFSVNNGALFKLLVTKGIFRAFKKCYGRKRLITEVLGPFREILVAWILKVVFSLHKTTISKRCDCWRKWNFELFFEF